MRCLTMLIRRIKKQSYKLNSEIKLFNRIAQHTTVLYLLLNYVMVVKIIIVKVYHGCSKISNKIRIGTGMIEGKAFKHL